MKVPVVAVSPLPLTCVACCPPSDEPRPSMIARVGTVASNAFLTGAERAAPPLMRSINDERS